MGKTIQGGQRRKARKGNRIPLEPSHSILLEIPFHGNLLKVKGKVDGFIEL
jgi:hypothetical protein